MMARAREYTDCMNAPRLLAIDTATEHMAVAVVVGEREFCAQEIGGARASLRLLPLVFELLQAAGLQAAQVDAVAFGRGPGAFTGARPRRWRRVWPWASAARCCRSTAC
jgi:tRNA N6-adenosine threonylcarbamoyltransferase